MDGNPGKGDSPRPKSISEAEYGKKYEQIFGKKVPWWATEQHQKLRAKRMKFEQKLREQGL